MNTKLILVLAFLVALVLDVVITIILKNKKKEDDFLVDFIHDEDLDYDDELDEYVDDYIEEDKENDEPSVSSILNKLIPKKEKEFEDLRIDLEEQKAPEPIENDWLDEDLRDIDNLIDLTCEDVIKAAKMAKSEALNADLKDVIEKINTAIMSNISSNYKNSIEYKIWDPSHRGLDLMHDIVMPLARFYENKGFDVKISNVNNPKNIYSRQYAMITISWSKDLKSVAI